MSHGTMQYISAAHAECESWLKHHGFTWHAEHGWTRIASGPETAYKRVSVGKASCVKHNNVWVASYTSHYAREHMRIHAENVATAALATVSISTLPTDYTEEPQVIVTAWNGFWCAANGRALAQTTFHYETAAQVLQAAARLLTEALR